MRVKIEFEEIVTRVVMVGCQDLQVAREVFEEGADRAEAWVDQSWEKDSRIDWDSGSFSIEEDE